MTSDFFEFIGMMVLVVGGFAALVAHVAHLHIGISDLATKVDRLEQYAKNSEANEGTCINQLNELADHLGVPDDDDSND